MGNYNLKSIISKPLLQHVLLANDACLMPLFHGTDMAVFQMTPEARAELRKYCAFFLFMKRTALRVLVRRKNAISWAISPLVYWRSHDYLWHRLFSPDSRPLWCCPLMPWRT